MGERRNSPRSVVYLHELRGAGLPHGLGGELTAPQALNRMRAIRQALSVV